MRLLPALILLLGFTSPFVAAAPLVLKQGEVRLPMPGRTVTAGYFTAENSASHEVELVKASSPAFARVELHQHIRQDDVMRMVEVESISLEPGATLVFQPGGLHLMLFEPQVELRLGDSVRVSLYFADGSSQDFELPLAEMPRR